MRLFLAATLKASSALPEKKKKRLSPIVDLAWLISSVSYGFLSIKRKPLVVAAITVGSSARMAATRRSTRSAPKIPSLAAGRGKPGWLVGLYDRILRPGLKRIKWLDTSGRQGENSKTTKRDIGKEEMERVAECHCGLARNHVGTA
jgi:hypothetical protein